MPGWAAGNAIIGLVLGYAFRLTTGMKSRGFRMLLLAFCVTISCAAGILGVKSLTECLLYGQPFIARVVKNSYAFTADTAVLLLSIPICEAVSMGRRASAPVRD